jgi:hypothetical protein
MAILLYGAKHIDFSMTCTCVAYFLTSVLAVQILLAVNLSVCSRLPCAVVGVLVSKCVSTWCELVVSKLLCQRKCPRITMCTHNRNASLLKCSCSFTVRWAAVALKSDITTHSDVSGCVLGLKEAQVNVNIIGP